MLNNVSFYPVTVSAALPVIRMFSYKCINTSYEQVCESTIKTVRVY